MQTAALEILASIRQAILLLSCVTLDDHMGGRLMRTKTVSDVRYAFIATL